MFTKMAHEAFMKLKQVRRRSWGGGYHIYIYFVFPRSFTVLWLRGWDQAKPKPQKTVKNRIKPH